MILTHLVFFEFFPGAGAAAAAVTGDFHDGWRKRDNKERDKRFKEQVEEAQTLREQIETAYADVTGERKVPEVAEITATEKEVKAWKEPGTRRDGLAYLAHIKSMLSNLQEIEQHVAKQQALAIEESDVAWIVEQLRDL